MQFYLSENRDFDFEANSNEPKFDIIVPFESRAFNPLVLEYRQGQRESSRPTWEFCSSLPTLQRTNINESLPRHVHFFGIFCMVVVVCNSDVQINKRQKGLG